MGDIDMEGSFLAKTLIINRILGLKHLIPGSGKWVVHDDKKSDCWKCGQHVLTIFLWSPRIGKLTCEKDPIKTKYYKDKLESFRNNDDSLAMNAGATPTIAATFNGWHYQRMQNVVTFCMENDLNPPDFVQECISDGLIKLNRSGKLTADQKATV